MLCNYNAALSTGVIITTEALFDTYGGIIKVTPKPVFFRISVDKNINITENITSEQKTLNDDKVSERDSMSSF